MTTGTHGDGEGELEGETGGGTSSAAEARDDVTASSVESPEVVVTIPGEAGPLLHWLAVHNPFYLLSAALVLIGLNAGFDTSYIWVNTAVPLAVLVGYTVLLALTAVLIVRLGKVWDDARSILLCVGGLLFCLSVGLDEMLTRDGPAWVWGNVGGLLVSLGVCESLRRGLGIRLRRSFGIPLAAILALLFLYPILPARLALAREMEALSWSLLGFPVLSAAVFLSFLPACRGGRGYGADNGTPWPALPWVLGAIGWSALAVRSYLMCVAFYPAPGVGGFHQLQNPFDLYLLEPLVLAGLTLLLEAGRAARRPWLQRGALTGMAVSLLWVTPVAAGNPAHRDVLELLTGTAASPICLTVWALVVIYGIAWLRRIEYAHVGALAALVLATVVTPNTADLTQLATPGATPLAALTAALVYLSWRQRASAWWLLSGWCGLATLARVLPDSALTARHGMVLWHLVYLVALAVGAIRDDTVARLLRRLCPWPLPVAYAAALFGYREVFPDTPVWMVSAYCAAVLVVAGAAWWVCCEREYLVAGSMAMGLTVIKTGCVASQYAADLPVRGKLWFAGGIACFAVAFAISAAKGQLWRRDGPDSHGSGEGMLRPPMPGASR